ncbi:stage II sporulation protein D [Lysinibacillus sp. KU-BSD001]|uniref:stage II sporulation protein D n=1 Tax=Lysinibacillus sp. KU-BSD001 TaxID=3141328 RepID=UPI0036EFD9CE
MKKYIIFVALIILLFIIPLQYKKNQTQTQTSQEEEDCEVFITLTESNEQIALEQYLIGVVAGEMPASFHPEALKAQAIAARTYAMHQTSFGTTPIKQTTAHQVFKEERDPKYEEKLKEAVTATKNQILTYNDEPITAMFHAASNGQTESAQNYSGSTVAYLTTVSTPEEYTDTQTFTLTQLNDKLQTTLTLAQLQQAEITRNNTKRVETITIGGKTWNGRKFRELLNLKSTDFTITVNTDITIATKGYGHGVGMSQYGANELAQTGKTAEQILAHYYPNTQMATLACAEQ